MHNIWSLQAGLPCNYSAPVTNLATKNHESSRSLANDASRQNNGSRARYDESEKKKGFQGSAVERLGENTIGDGEWRLICISGALRMLKKNWRAWQ